MEPLSAADAASDLNVVLGLKRRDPSALAALYDRYGRIVYSITRAILGDADDAEEVVQEAFLRVWTRTHHIDLARPSIAPWLFTIARNLAIDRLRVRDMRYKRMHETTPESIPSPTPFEFPYRVDRLRAFENLSREQRQVIELAYFEGLSQTEISERIATPLGTVKTRVRMALGILRKSMGQHSLQKD